MKITTLFYPMIGETLAEAEDKKAAYDKLPNDVDSLSLLSEALNFDFSRKGLDDWPCESCRCSTAWPPFESGSRRHASR